ncbi:antibiotic biosynthesis monooxygenase family protein [Spirosoma pollinicola]|uniref:Antibiotic biosynthesis monooxygenase n=1 Tax=Spirosoma pollinicola TaxID=2057025 RepID=A0A2K8YTN2_9BACT|nr:antibiotic biosynthesis monooxygenase family protein [Spirosoma pollinicola]AUD00996.1 antibiotic biosynthesis monooxygenase [Spirosoma pollinicola]
MLNVQELDQFVAHQDQLKDDNQGPVVLVNIFHVAPEKGDDLLAVWANILQTFKSQSGFISAQFHRGTAGSGTFLNYAVWESTAAYRAAYENPAFRERLPAYPEWTTATPHLFRKVAIENVCVA